MVKDYLTVKEVKRRYRTAPGFFSQAVGVHANTPLKDKIGAIKTLEALVVIAGDKAQKPERLKELIEKIEKDTSIGESFTFNAFRLKRAYILNGSVCFTIHDLFTVLAALYGNYVCYDSRFWLSALRIHRATVLFKNLELKNSTLILNKAPMAVQYMSQTEVLHLLDILNIK